MKKVLFATTALVATAGVAAADVSLSGSAEMGIFGGDGVDESFFTDIDVTFTMSGTTDNGLTFGASVDLDESDDDGGGTGSGAFSPNDDGGATIFLSGNFGTLTMGDTDGALDWALTEAWVGNAGSLNDDETSHAGALGSYGDGAYDGQIVRYDYSVGDFGFAVSVEMDDANVSDDGFALGFRYGIDIAGGSVDLGLGYQTFNSTGTAGDPLSVGDYELIAAALAGDFIDVDIIGLSAAVELDNGLSAGLQYSMWEVDGVIGGVAGSDDIDHIGVGVGYTFDAFTVSANWGEFSSDANGDISGYGLAAAYDLGGGLSAHLGYGNSDLSEVGGAGEIETWSFGLAMSF